VGVEYLCLRKSKKFQHEINQQPTDRSAKYHGTLILRKNKQELGFREEEQTQTQFWKTEQNHLFPRTISILGNKPGVASYSVSTEAEHPSAMEHVPVEQPRNPV
jgi:hypothetical protein